jgi:hypothetical protein
MTVEELSESTKRNLEDVQEAILYIKNGPDIHPRTRLEDMNVIKDIIKKLGLRMRIAAAPQKAVEVEEKDRDVKKRPPALPELLKPRAPVVTVSLSNKFRKSI